MSRGDEKVELTYVEVEHKTASAWLIVFQAKTKTRPEVKEWMPRSQCSLHDDGETIVAPRWLVEKKGLDQFA